MASDTPAAVIIAGLRANPRWAAVLETLEAEARGEEREACARLAEQESDYCGVPIAELIRARNTP